MRNSNLIIVWNFKFPSLTNLVSIVWKSTCPYWNSWEMNRTQAYLSPRDEIPMGWLVRFPQPRRDQKATCIHDDHFFSQCAPSVISSESPSFISGFVVISAHREQRRAFSHSLVIPFLMHRAVQKSFSARNFLSDGHAFLDGYVILPLAALWEFGCYLTQPLG